MHIGLSGLTVGSLFLSFSLEAVTSDRCQVLLNQTEAHPRVDQLSLVDGGSQLIMGNQPDLI